MAEISLDLDKYLKADLFAELGIENLSFEEQATFLEKIGEVLQARISLRLMKELSEDQKDQLETLLTNHPDDAVALGVFLKNEVPNLEQIIEEEVAQYKKDLIERAKDLTNQQD